MPADATDLLDSFEAGLNALYPAVAVRVSKRRAADGKQLQGGWTEGYPLPCLVLSCSEPEQVDDFGTFEEYMLRYSVLVEYVKPAEQRVTGEAGKPPTVVEDPDVRDVRQSLMDTFYVSTRAGLSRLFDVRVRPRNVYDPSGGGKLLATGVVFTCDIWRPRPGSS